MCNLGNARPCVKGVNCYELFRVPIRVLRRFDCKSLSPGEEQAEGEQRRGGEGEIRTQTESTRCSLFLPLSPSVFQGKG